MAFAFAWVLPRIKNDGASASAGAPQPSEPASDSDPPASARPPQPIEQIYDSQASVPAEATQPTAKTFGGFIRSAEGQASSPEYF